VIPDWQTNHVYFSGMLRRRHRRVSASLASMLELIGTAVGTIPKTKDIWCREFMPVQVDEDTFCQFKYDPRGHDHLKTPATSCR
jgi:agmatine deiminase